MRGYRLADYIGTVAKLHLIEYHRLHCKQRTPVKSCEIWIMVYHIVKVHLVTSVCHSVTG